jgi:hypothetical protein
LLTLLMEGAMFFTQQKSDHNAKLWTKNIRSYSVQEKEDPSIGYSSNHVKN